MIKLPPLAFTLLARRKGIRFEKLAEGDPTEWIALIVTLAIFVGMFCFILFRTGHWKMLAGMWNSLTTATLLGALLGIVIPVLLVNILGIEEYLLLLILGAYLGAVFASPASTESALSHATVVAILIGLLMAVRAYYVAVDKTSPGAIFPPWLFFVPVVFVATWLLAMLGGMVLFGALARRQSRRDVKTIAEKEPLSESDNAPLVSQTVFRAALISLILIISLGALTWQVTRYAREHRILRTLNEDFWNTASRSDQIGIRVRWSQAEPDDSWWLELFRIRLGGSRLPRITRLIGNKLADDEALIALQVLPNLSDLHLGEANITDAGLVHLQHLPNLRRLDLGVNSVTDEAVAALQEKLPEVQIK